MGRHQVGFHEGQQIASNGGLEDVLDDDFVPGTGEDVLNNCTVGEGVEAQAIMDFEF